MWYANVANITLLPEMGSGTNPNFTDDSRPRMVRSGGSTSIQVLHMNVRIEGYQDSTTEASILEVIQEVYRCTKGVTNAINPLLNDALKIPIKIEFNCAFNYNK
jgi:hypothetical protein